MTVLVVMGVSGCGKSTVGEGLSERLGWPFLEGDSLHPPENVAKMESGQPLTDDDRWPWLERIADWIEERHDAGEDGVVTCSALKRSYRKVLDRRGDGVVFVFLHGERETLEARMRARTGHFMPASMLASQLETLEPPGADEPAIPVAIEQSPEEIVQQVVTALTSR
ncbi:gluconokinase [Nocardioides ferulae]|uniref:gluconokinase n=1 Tax=Nocardioides ferulae TaxID=2340821 RepID=UPI000EB1A23B|nr:gluconokinase [Nocardioides ferulae]